MNYLPIDPDADSRRRAWLPCPNCNVKQRPPQPERLRRCCARLHVENLSATRQVDALRAWLRDNIPSTALRVSMRRNGYGILLDQQFGRPLRQSCAPEPRMPRLDLTFDALDYARQLDGIAPS